ncbi:hypothetical protein Tco_1188833 [Tanacetum coccineum]
MIKNTISNQEVNVPSNPKKNVVPRRKRTITYADNLLETEDEAILLSKSVSTDEQRLQKHQIMTQLTIEKPVDKDVEEAYASERVQKLKGVTTKDPTIQSLLDL